ncbi:carph-isopro domain-containing protein [Pseudohoeflea coraliihabitans]|nr:hypothetical protein [Pseudohoeflea sp. DP4N28-3]
MKTPSEMIIDKLGGLTKTARMLSTDEKPFPITTVQGWKVRGKIPQEYWLPLIDASREVGIDIDLQDFLAAPTEAAE